MYFHKVLLTQSMAVTPVVSVKSVVPLINTVNSWAESEMQNYLNL